MKSATKPREMQISISNQFLKGSITTKESYFRNLGEKGLAVYFLIAKRMNGEQKTWISIADIRDALGFQGRDVTNIRKTLAILQAQEVIYLDTNVRNTETIKVGDEIEVTFEYDLSQNGFTRFYANNFQFYHILDGTSRAKFFGLFCIIESYIGTNEEGFPSLETLVEKTGFARETILKYIYIFEKLGIYTIKGRDWESPVKKSSTRFIKNKAGRVKFIGGDLQDIQAQAMELGFEYEDIKQTRREQGETMPTPNTLEEQMAIPF